VRRKARDTRVGKTQLFLKGTDFLKIDRADNVDNRKFARFARNDRKARHLVIV
jgi:hypothetical protein